MRFDLAAMAQRARKTRRKEVVLRPVVLPSTLASDLFAGSYSPILRAWTEALPSILAEYERALSGLTMDDAADIGLAVERTESGVAVIFLTVRARLTAWARRVERYQAAKWRAAVLTASGVDISTMIGPEDVRDTLGAAIERNVALVRNVSDQARGRIADAVFRGLRERKPAREVAAELRESVAMGRRRALLVSSDQTTKLASSLAEERMRQAGIEYYEWRHSGKLHPREEHRARDGKRYKLGEPAGDTPGQAIYCGCVAQAALSLDGEF